jgi:hypothetical protein
MADKRTAIEDVRSVARTFQAVIDLANSLDGLTSIETATQHAKVELEKLRAAADLARGTRDSALHAAQEADKNAASLVDQAHAKAQQIVADAEQAAKQSREQSSARAQQIEADGAERLESLRSQGSLIIESIRQKQAELDALEAKIEAARKRIAKMLEG